MAFPRGVFAREVSFINLIVYWWPSLFQVLLGLPNINMASKNILHLLDDLLTLDPPDGEATRTVASITLILNKLGLEYSLPKTVGPTTSIEYLGIFLDTQAMECHLPEDKLLGTSTMVKEFRGKSKCTQHGLLSLLSHLDFAAGVVPPGTTFIFRLFHVAYSVTRLHHRVYLNREAKVDLAMQAVFLDKIWLFYSQSLPLLV